MPFIAALIVSLGSFTGYVVHDTRVDKDVVRYYKGPVTKTHLPYFHDGWDAPSKQVVPVAPVPLGTGGEMRI